MKTLKLFFLSLGQDYFEEKWIPEDILRTADFANMRLISFRSTEILLLLELDFEAKLPTLGLFLFYICFLVLLLCLFLNKL